MASREESRGPGRRGSMAAAMTPAPSPLGSIARALATDARGLLDNRAAFFGGLGGLSIAVLLAYGAAA